MTEPPGAEPADVLGLLRAARNQMFERHAAAQEAVKHHAHQAELLGAELAALNAMIDRLSENPATIDAAMTTPFSVRADVGAASATITLGPGRPPDSTREAILALLRSEDRAFSISEILAGVQHLGTKEASTRSILTKMFKDADSPVERVDRGQYRARRDSTDGRTPSRPTPVDAPNPDPIPPPDHAPDRGLPTPGVDPSSREARLPTPAEFMAMRSHSGDAEEELDVEDSGLFFHDDLRGHPAHGEDQPTEESAPT